MADTSNSTQMNVDIGATDSSTGRCSPKRSRHLSSLWSKIGAGSVATAASVAGLAGIAVGLSAAVKQSTEFQAQLTGLVTGAGESEKNLSLVKSGIEGIATSTGTTLAQLTSGMFMIVESGRLSRSELVWTF